MTIKSFQLDPDAIPPKEYGLGYQERSDRRVSSAILWIVYGFVAAATFRHSAWGFGTLESSLNPIASPFWIFPAEAVALLTFWGTGVMAAFAVDAGMAGLVFAIRESVGGKWESLKLYCALGVAMAASGFTQLLYAVTHAAPAPLPFNVANWMLPVALAVWEWRIIVLPLLLPSLGLVYAFAAGMKHVVNSEGSSRSDLVEIPERNNEEEGDF